MPGGCHKGCRPSPSSHRLHAMLCAQPCRKAATAPNCCGPFSPSDREGLAYGPPAAEDWASAHHVLKEPFLTNAEMTTDKINGIHHAPWDGLPDVAERKDRRHRRSFRPSRQYVLRRARLSPEGWNGRKFGQRSGPRNSTRPDNLIRRHAQRDVSAPIRLRISRHPPAALKAGIRRDNSWP